MTTNMIHVIYIVYIYKKKITRKFPTLVLAEIDANIISTRLYRDYVKRTRRSNLASDDVLRKMRSVRSPMLVAKMEEQVALHAQQRQRQSRTYIAVNISTLAMGEKLRNTAVKARVRSAKSPGTTVVSTHAQAHK